MMARAAIVAVLVAALAACGMSGGKMCIGSFCPDASPNLECSTGTGTLNADGSVTCPKSKGRIK